MNQDETYDLHSAAGYFEPEKSSSDIRTLAEMERVYIEEVIAFCNGNIPRAAKILEISPSTIYRKQVQWQKTS